MFDQQQPDASAPLISQDCQQATAHAGISDASTLPPQGISFGMVVAIAFTAAIISAAAMLVAYDHFMTIKFLSVDVKGFVQEQRELYIAGKITEDQLRQRFVDLKSVIEKIPRNRVVLMGDAVLGGAEKIDLSAIGNNAPK